jgi:enamine deaminase RidA (YjgF/YER057c/UK114 family)
MDRYALYSGSKFAELAGYSRAVVDGDWIFVSGTAGYEPATGKFADGAANQARRALETIAETLTKAGSSLADIVQVRVYLADRADVMPRLRDPRPDLLRPAPDQHHDPVRLPRGGHQGRDRGDGAQESIGAASPPHVSGPVLTHPSAVMPGATTTLPGPISSRGWPGQARPRHGEGGAGWMGRTIHTLLG